MGCECNNPTGFDSGALLNDQGGYKELAPSNEEGVFLGGNFKSSLKGGQRKIGYNDEDFVTEEEKNAKPEDEFSRYIFDNINTLRENPQYYIDEIEEAKKYIKKTHNGKLVYKHKVSVALDRGGPAFDEAKEFLRGVEPMRKLIYNPRLVVELPENEEDVQNRNYLNSRVKELDEKGIYVKSYWRDIVKDPESSFLLMLIDDNGDKSGMRRSDILNPEIKYIGINSISIGKSFVCYILLSDTK